MDHLTTISGKRINLFEMRPEDFDIQDIAHSLSMINRFNGHVTHPISVAQHSVFVSWLCDDTPFALQGLLHDGAEAYVGDVTKWLKETEAMAAYRKTEESIQRLLLTTFKCAPELSSPVLRADKLMVRYEAWRGGMIIHNPNYPEPNREERVQLEDLRWTFWDQQTAKDQFMNRFFELSLRSTK